MSDNKPSSNNTNNPGDPGPLTPPTLSSVEGEIHFNLDPKSTENNLGYENTRPHEEVKNNPIPIASTEASGDTGFSRILNNPNSPWIFLIVSVIVILAVCNHYWKFINFQAGNAPRVVLFDPIKFMNAQRAAISVLAARPDNNLSFTLTQVAKQAESVILEEANGAVILLKQAVVVPRNMEDITDKVLLRFDLPTDVPTVTVNVIDENSSAFVAPTDYSFSARESQDNYKEELSSHRQKLVEKMDKASNQEKMVP